MDSNHKDYDFTASFDRIDDILAQSTANFEERKSLPDRDTLTYDNGFYAYCTALFIDIRDSSSLPGLYDRPALARLYRAFISEIVAIFNSHKKTREVNIVGDCVWAVINTPQKADINSVFDMMSRANSLIKVLNFKLKAAGYSKPIVCGMGAAYGRALMIKAGQKGSTISDVVYMGDVVNRAAKLASQANKGSIRPILLEPTFQSNLKDEYKGLTLHDSTQNWYSANSVNIVMEKWFNENCK